MPIDEMPDCPEKLEKIREDCKKKRENIREDCKTKKEKFNDVQFDHDNNEMMFGDDKNLTPRHRQRHRQIIGQITW